MLNRLQPLLAAVQRNCDIADARHAGEFTLCVYLLKMREYFRWERGYDFRRSLPESDVSDWLRKRESFWETVEEESYARLPLDGRQYDPFDDRAMNSALNPRGLVYSGGMGARGVPHFFLGKLIRSEDQAGVTILVSDTEYARDLAAPPAMTRDNTIYIRRESLRRMVWEKLEEWRWNRLDNAMGRTIRGFDFESDTDSALDAMTDMALEMVLLHEKGEVLAGEILGGDWEKMLAAVPPSRTDLMIRAVRDHLVDSMMTLPGLLGQGRDEALHFFFASLTNMRKHLSPALMQAYDAWRASGKRREIEAILPASESHWRQLAERILTQYRRDSGNCADSLAALIEESRLLEF